MLYLQGFKRELGFICRAFPPEYLSVSGTLADPAENADFMTRAKDESKGTQLAKWGRFNLKCGDRVSYQATDCGGKEAVFSWSAVNLPALYCAPPPAPGTPPA